MIATRSSFHKDCPNTFMDRCLFQVELTLNLLHPFEYDPTVSAHHGLFKTRFDFNRHPIAPLGAKVLTWDSPETRGSWADHGINGIHLGPAMRHFRVQCESRAQFGGFSNPSFQMTNYSHQTIQKSYIPLHEIALSLHPTGPTYLDGVSWTPLPASAASRNSNLSSINPRIHSSRPYTIVASKYKPNSTRVSNKLQRGYRMVPSYEHLQKKIIEPLLHQ
jgi:hypothetical protein